MISAVNLAEELDGKRSGDGWVARCPAHDDTTPSLSINEGRNGGVVFRCHAGCDQGKVIAALTQMGLWRDPVTSKNGNRKGHRLKSTAQSLAPTDIKNLLRAEPVATWVYRTASGEIVGYVCRLHSAQGEKSFRPLTPWESSSGKTEWRVSAMADPRPIYNLPALATRSDDPVLLVEGEKAADAAATLFPEYVVTTWPGGAKAWNKVEWSPLRGRRVTLWPDNDAPGREAMEGIASALSTVGAFTIATVRVPAALPKGWDLADAAPTTVRLEELLANAKPFDETLASYAVSARNLAAMDIPPREYLIEPFMATNSLSMIFAMRGVGKTWVSLSIAKALASGEPFLGFEVPAPVRVLFIDGEMTLVDLRDRLVALGAGELDNLELVPSEALHRDNSAININNPDHQARLLRTIERLEELGRRPSLIIFDNLSSLGGGIDENDNSALDGLLQWLVGVRHRDYAVLLVHHAGKSGDQRGASRREDLLDTSIKLIKPKDDSEDSPIPPGTTGFELEFVKTRGRPPVPQIMAVTLEENEDGTLELVTADIVPKLPQMKTLKAIYEGKEIMSGSNSYLVPYASQKDLVTDLNVSKAKVSKDISALKDKGWIIHREDSGGGHYIVTHEGVRRLQLHYSTLGPVGNRPTVQFPEQYKMELP